MLAFTPEPATTAPEPAAHRPSTGVKSRRAGLQSLHNLIVEAPAELRDQIRRMTRKQMLRRNLPKHSLDKQESIAGGQCTSVAFTESLALRGLSALIGNVGDAYDNVVAESIIGLFETEVVNRHARFTTLAEVE